ncbi:UNVERIFIED_CONTAM: hypothetical protein K2H54_003192 [Gekko kuhli]
MSTAEDDITPSTTGGVTPTTQRSKMFQQLYQQPLRWGHFNPDSTEETYVLTCGPWRESQFEPGLCKDYGYPQYGVSGEVAHQRWVTKRTRERSNCRLLGGEDYNAEARTKALEQGQREMKGDLEEVIRAIPDMVIRAVRVE